MGMKVKAENCVLTFCRAEVYEAVLKRQQSSASRTVPDITATLLFLVLTPKSADRSIAYLIKS